MPERYFAVHEFLLIIIGVRHILPRIGPAVQAHARVHGLHEEDLGGLGLDTNYYAHMIIFCFGDLPLHLRYQVQRPKQYQVSGLRVDSKIQLADVLVVPHGRHSAGATRILNSLVVATATIISHFYFYFIECSRLNVKAV